MPVAEEALSHGARASRKRRELVENFPQKSNRMTIYNSEELITNENTRVDRFRVVRSENGQRMTELASSNNLVVKCLNTMKYRNKLGYPTMDKHVTKLTSY